VTRRKVTALLVAVAIAAGATPARADSSDCESKVTRIAQTLDQDARHARTWRYAWLGIGTAFLAGNVTLAAVGNQDLRPDYVVGATLSAFIPAMLLVHPPEVIAAAETLDARLAATTVGGRLGDPCIALERARELAARSADDEALASGWLAHALVIGGNVAGALVLALGYGHYWPGAALQLFGGSAIGELQVLTAATGALSLRGAGLSLSF
jgi:hypothetical protein